MLDKVGLEHGSKSTKYELEGSYGDPVHEHNLRDTSIVHCGSSMFSGLASTTTVSPFKAATAASFRSNMEMYEHMNEQQTTSEGDDDANDETPEKQASPFICNFPKQQPKLGYWLPAENSNPCIRNNVWARPDTQDSNHRLKLCLGSDTHKQPKIRVDDLHKEGLSPKRKK